MVKKILVLAMLASFIPQVRADFKAEKKAQQSSLNAEKKLVVKALKNESYRPNHSLLKKRKEYLKLALTRTNKAKNSDELGNALSDAFASYPSVPFAKIPINTSMATLGRDNAIAQEKKKLLASVKVDESSVSTGGDGINAMPKPKIIELFKAADTLAEKNASAEMDSIDKNGGKLYTSKGKTALQEHYEDHLLNVDRSGGSQIIDFASKRIPVTKKFLIKRYLNFLVNEKRFQLKSDIKKLEFAVKSNLNAQQTAKKALINFNVTLKQLKKQNKNGSNNNAIIALATE